MFNFFKNEKIRDGCIEVSKKDSLFSKAYLHYKRPVYDLILQRGWSYTNDTERKSLEKAQKESYAMIVNKIFISYAEKIFIRSEGFTDKNNNQLEKLSVIEQFEYIKKYCGYALIDMVMNAFKIDITSKKNFDN